MVDVIREDGTVKPFSDIKRKSLSGNKMIYNATCYGNYCYLACGFGIVVLDMVRLEIKDSFIIGDQGNYQPVYDVAVMGNDIYAGTDTGIKHAEIEGNNLLDYSSWYYIENELLEDYNYNFLDMDTEGRLWAVHLGSGSNDDVIFRMENDKTWSKPLGDINNIDDFRIFENKVIISSWSVFVYNANSLNRENVIGEYPFQFDELSKNPGAATYDAEGALWIADKNYGAIRVHNGKYDRVSPEGPSNNNNYSMSFSDNKLWVASGGRTASWNNVWKNAHIKGYANGQWEYFNKYNTPSIGDLRDVVDVVAKPGHPNHVFAASWGGGVLEFENGEHVTTYNETNSTLENIYPGQNYVRIGGLDFDDDGNLWATTSSVELNLHKKTPGGDWEGFLLPEVAFNYNIGKVLAASNGLIWMIIPNNKTKGLYVMSANGKNKKHLNVASYFSNGTDEVITVMNDVYDIVEDRDGEIWVGTSKGVAKYSRPANVFDESPFYAMQPGVDRNDGIYHPLLRTQKVTCIVVDGGNRKWLGTENSGLFLVSADGTRELAHYTAEDSPLLSNTIISMAYDGNTGDLYVGTKSGLVSFRTDSKKAYGQFEDVYAYPNPVRPGYEGNIYINGMMEDTNVKITTVSGRLVYETTSIGGRAVWDGRDLAGERVHTGIYLVFCAANEGQESVVTKIAFIR
jgi:ligand-binding sensor domain-containing protein